MRKILLLTSILGAPTWAAIESPNVFIGAKRGYQWAQDDSHKYSNPTGTIFSVYSGLTFSSAWSWDVGYQYHDDLKVDDTSVNVKTWLVESALRYDWYLQDNLSLYGRLGAAYWDMEKTQPSLDNLNATGFSPLGEVGVNYSFAPKFRLSAGYQYIESIGQSNTGKYDSHAFLIGLTYTLGDTTQPVLSEESPMPVKETVVETPPQTVKELVVVETSPQIFTFSSKTMSVFFGFDSAAVSHDDIEQLTEIVSVLNAYPQAQAIVAGHTDSSGSKAYNQALAKRRAEAITNKLIELGVRSVQVEIHNGETRTVANDLTAEGQAQHRRVEITIPSFQFKE